jgi:hypothetical protein
MQRALFFTSVTAVLTALAVSDTGCGSTPVPRAQGAAQVPASDSPSAVSEASAMEADVYAQVLRRYLSTPAENSFPGRAFTTVYVLNRAYPDAADPSASHARGVPIALQTQLQVTAALAGMAPVVFVGNSGSVMEAVDGCAQVRRGGILITLGPPVRHGPELRVGIGGFVACLGATWLTYVLQVQPGVGWRVTGTTGSMAIS